MRKPKVNWGEGWDATWLSVMDRLFAKVRRRCGVSAIYEVRHQVLNQDTEQIAERISEWMHQWPT